MVATIFNACRRYTYDVELHVAVEHFLHGIETLAAIFLSRFVRLLFNDVTYCHNFRVRVLLIDPSMDVADVAHADDSYF